MYRPRKLTAIVFTLLFALPTFVAAQQRQAPPWFDVEVIVFTRDAETAGNNELWPSDPGDPQLDGAWRLSRAGDSGQGYTLLPQSQWHMKPIAYSLRQGRGRLRPLIHVAWRQPVSNPRTAHPVSLRSDKRNTNDTPLLQGVIKVSINRYLHVDLDLLLQGALKQQGENGGFLPGEFQTYRFQAHRRMRSGEIHYIDHPLMGALVLINRFEMPESQPENEEAAQQGNTQDTANDDLQSATPPTAD